MAASSANNEKIEPVLYLLTGIILVFAGLLVWVEHFFKDDGQVFQVISNILSGMAGAFLIRIKPPNQAPPPPPAGTSSTTVSSTETP